MGDRSRFAALALALAFAFVGCTSSSSSTGASTGPSGACEPYNGSVTQGPNGAHCDSNGDCSAPTCKCADGTHDNGQHLCNSGICDGDKACTLFCASHGGAGPCDAGTD